MSRSSVLAAAALLGLLAVQTGCGERQAATAQASAPASRPVAEVGGTAITEAELDAQLARLFGEERALEVDADTRRKALESLVMARVIAMEADKDFSPAEQIAFDAQAKLYLDQLKVAAYLRRHASPQPVTAQMVEDYYNKHPDRFGGGTVRTFEMIMASDAPAEVQRTALLKAFADAGANSDWTKLAQTLTAQGHKVEYRRGDANDQLLDQRLSAVIGATGVQQTSAPGLLNRKPFVVRVLSETERAPKPLAEVSAEIRRSLAPTQMKEAVREITDSLMQQVEVKYLADNDE